LHTCLDCVAGQRWHFFFFVVVVVRVDVYALTEVFFFFNIFLKMLNFIFCLWFLLCAIETSFFFYF
jgi:hypothetical protein